MDFLQVKDDNEESLLGEFQFNRQFLKPKFIEERILKVPDQIKKKGKEGKRWFLRTLLEPSYRKGHVFYFAFFGLLGAIFIFLLELDNPSTDVDFIDAFFTSISAICVTGLTTVDISLFRIQTQLCIMLLMQLGSVVMLTLTTIVIRRYYFRKRFGFLGSSEIERNVQPSSIDNDHVESSMGMSASLSVSNFGETTVSLEKSSENLIELDRNLEKRAPNYNNTIPQQRRGFNEASLNSVESENANNLIISNRKSLSRDKVFIKEAQNDDIHSPSTTINTNTANTNSNMNDISTIGNTDGNGSTDTRSSNRDLSPIQTQQNPSLRGEEIPLTEDEKRSRRLEYEALGKLMWIISLYIIITYLVAFLAISYYLTFSESASEVLQANGNIHPAYWSSFYIISAFNNVGFSLFSNSLEPFKTNRFVLMMLSILIAMGNTGFPIFLRLVIFVLRRTTKNFAPYKILLVRPRSLFTHLFPSTESRMLSLTWIVITVTQFFLFLILNVNHPSLAGMSIAERFLTAWFASVCTRTAGFTTIDLSLVQQGMLVYLVVMMYISSYPFTVTLHQSVQAEHSSSIYLDTFDEEASQVQRSESGTRLEKTNRKRSATKSLLRAISFHTQSLFYQHIVWLFLVWFLVVAIESNRITADGSYFDIFKVIFEIASAYGTVGLSLGYPGSVTSFSGILSPFSKLLIMSVMFLGRHRGLPSSFDPAISLYQRTLSTSNDAPQQGAPIQASEGNLAVQTSTITTSDERAEVMADKDFDI